MDNLIALPRGLYSKTNINGIEHHSIMFYFDTHNFSVGCDSFNGLLSLVNELFCMHRNFNTVTEYNRAVLNSLEDTVRIDITELKKSA